MSEGANGDPCLGLETCNDHDRDAQRYGMLVTLHPKNSGRNAWRENRKQHRIGNIKIALKLASIELVLKKVSSKKHSLKSSRILYIGPVPQLGYLLGVPKTATVL